MGLTQELIEAALNGERSAQRQLAVTLEPLIRKTIRQGLRKFGQVHWRSTEVDVDDLVQDMFFCLLKNDAKVLRVWEPERGVAFLRVVVNRRLIALLRNRRTNQRHLLPVEDDLLSFLLGGTRDGAARFAAAHTLHTLLARLRARLTPLAWRMFNAIFIEQLSTSEIAASFDMKRNNIHQWRNRLRRACQAVRAEIEGE